MSSSAAHQLTWRLFVTGCITMLAPVFILATPRQSEATGLNSMLHNSDNLGTAKGTWGVAGGRYGTFTCNTCHSADTPEIKRVRDQITAPQGVWSSSKSQTVTVRFRNLTSYGDPSAHPSSTHICEVCHSKTSVHRYNQLATPHNGQVDCTSCHLHKDGFKPAGGSCGNCHNSPPTTGEHGEHFGVGSASYGQASVLSTAAAYGFSCGVCHSGTHRNSTANPRTAEVVFAGIANQSGAATYTPGTTTVENPGNGYTFNYSDGTCANLYCHGNYQGSGKKASPRWEESATGACGTCHNATNTTPPASGSHSRHASTGQHAYSLKCTLCHNDTTSGTSPASYTIADKSKHVNGTVNWKFDQSDPRVLPTSSYSIPSGTALPSDGSTPRAYGTCTNTYCHSIVQTATGGKLTGQAGEYKETPQWGTAWGMDACGNCHGGGHGTNLTSGSHSKHLTYSFGLGVGAGTNCTICHKWNASAAYGDCQQCHDSAGRQNHVNGLIDVRFDPYWSGDSSYGGTPTPGDGFGSCANVYCHSNGTGGTKNSGETRAIAANSSPVWGGTAPCGSCHGLPPSYASGSPKANSHGVHVTQKGIACKSCHASTLSAGMPDPTSHVNGIYDVTPDGTSGASFMYHYAADGGTCDSVSCHGSGRKWGTYGDAVFLSFRSAAELNNTMEPMPNNYLATGSYLGSTGYSTTAGAPGRRAMTPTFGTVEESVTQTTSGTGNYRVAQFVSPRLSQGVSLVSGKTFTISIRHARSGIFNSAYLRYTLYQWKANDTQGTNFRTIAQDTTNIPTSATNRTVSLTTNSAVMFAAGDRIVCEIEFYNSGSSSATVSHYWGNNNSNYAGLALPVTMNFLTEN